MIQPFDQDAWARGYGRANVITAMAAFTVLREWNAQFIEVQAAGTFDKTLNHPERGAMTFRTLVETMAGHDLNHLAQMAAP